MSAEKIRIIIEGGQGSGKSKIAQIIANALRLCGLVPYIKDDEPDLAPHCMIEIETRQSE